MNIWHKESLRQKIYSDLLSQLIRGDIVPGSPLPSCSQLQKNIVPAAKRSLNISPPA